MKTKRIKLFSSDKVFNGFVIFILTLVGLTVLYPLLYVLSCSFSDPNAVMSGKVVLWPVDATLEGYRAVFRNGKVLLGFRNSLFYTVFGTLVNLFMTTICAYPLSRKDLPGRSGIMMFFSFTMIFSGGMIPNYLLIRDIGLLDSVWALIVPGSLSVYNMIIMRTYFMNSIPDELLEASKLDGCGDIKYLTSVVMPLSKSIFAVVTMYYAVAHWNAYFNAFMYLSNEDLYPLQVFLREILIASKVDAEMLVDEVVGSAPIVGLEHILKYSLIVVATIPMLIIYPFVQKHFVKGVMIGAVKG